MSENLEPDKYDNELSVGLIVKIVQDYVQYLWTKKWWISLCGILVSIPFFLMSYLKEPTYIAKLSFMIAEEDKGQGLAGAIGNFPLGGLIGGSADMNLEKVMALSKTRKIVEKVLMDTVSTANWEGPLANLLIDSLGVHEAWEEDPVLKGFYFTATYPDSFVYYKALKSLKQTVVGNADRPGVTSLTLDDKSGLMYFTANTRSERLSLLLAQTQYKFLSQYYIENSVGQRRSTVKNLQSRLDSVKTELRSVEYSHARLVDQVGRIPLRKDRLNIERLERDRQILTILYGETLKNYEAAYFLLKSETPAFQMIDSPVRPLDVDADSPLKKLIIGGIVGGILSVIGFVVWKIIQDSIKGEAVN